jgi:hypothetical protein
MSRGEPGVRSITEAEIASFRENGWAYLPGLVDRGTILRLHSRARSLLAAQLHLGGFGEVVDRAFYAFPGEGRKDDFVGKFVRSPVMGSNIARLLVVPQVRLFADGYMLKLPQSGGQHLDTPYHQDFSGNPVDRSSFLSLWVALHDMSAEAGTMRFYSRSQRLGVFGQVFADGTDLRERCAELLDEDLSAPTALLAGDATAHHSLTVHGAAANQTKEPRWAYNVIYIDRDARYTAGPGPFPPGVTLEPFARFDHPAFPLLPTA